MKLIHNKLVRDKIPEIINQAGKECKIKILKKILKDDKYSNELKKKLCEEAKEVLETKSKQELIGEISDVLEIIDALKEVYKIDDQELIKAKNSKANKNGAFKDGAFKEKIFLEYVIDNNNE